MRAPTPASEQKACNDFNAKHQIGTHVRYWKGRREGEATGEGVTTTAAQMMSGHTAVVWIAGCSGCVALSHVEPIIGERILVRAHPGLGGATLMVGSVGGVVVAMPGEMNEDPGERGIEAEKLADQLRRMLTAAGARVTEHER